MPDNFYIDGVSAFPHGINSGVAPLLLDRQTLAFAVNATVRGTYIKARPGFRKVQLDFGGDATLQFNFEQGLWQGAAFFASEYGFQALICAIGGRLFQLKPDSNNIWAVTDVSIVGDLNSSSNPISWLWQSERWMIVNDGSNLPLFYDGATNRRSFGTGQQLGVTAAPFTVPAVGATVTITLVANYTGPVNQVIYVEDIVTPFPKALYQVNAALAGYQITMTSLSEPPATVVPAGTQINIPSNLMGQLNAAATTTASVPQPGLPVCPPAGGGILTSSVANLILQAASPISVTPTPLPVCFNPGDTIYVRKTGTQYMTCIDYLGTGFVTAMSVYNCQPSITLAQYSPVYKGAPAFTSPLGLTLSQPLTTGAVGASVTAFLTNPYNGVLNQIVIIDGGAYLVTASNNTLTPTNIITIQNIGDTPTQIDAAGTILFTVPELSAGKMGAYGLGRNWEALTDGRSYIGSDIVGGSSGSPALNFRDSVLHTTENTYLAGGGAFVVPGNVGDIQSLTFSTVLDTSLGQGPLEIGTPNIIFSCNAPIDRTIWQAITNPIQTEALKGAGTQNQYGTINVNSDILFRSFLGLGSFAIARRDFSAAGSWGNTPISREVARILDADSIDLLVYGSAIEFQNRVLFTARPTVSNQGIFHFGIVALNLDPISSMGVKSPSVYDGLWTGLNVLQFVKGRISNDERAWAFGFNTIQSRIELYEITRDGVSLTDFDGITENRIQWSFETACLFKEVSGKSAFDSCKLVDGVFWVTDVVGTVNFEVFYRPQFSPCWTQWHTGVICAKERDLTNPADDLVKPQNKVLIGLGEPKYECDPINNRPYFISETFQFKFVFTGSCKFYGARFKAAPDPTPFFKRVTCEPICADGVGPDCQECKTLACVGDEDFTYQLEDIPAPPPPPVFFNQAVTACITCPDGETPTFSGTLPAWVTFDSETGCFTGAAGTYQATSQAQANIDAQTALNEFFDAAIANDTLVCASAACPNPTLKIENYVDGLVANPTGNPSSGQPVYDGKFVFFNGFSTWKATLADVTDQMDGKLICNIYIRKVAGIYNLEFWDDQGGKLWAGNNGSTTSPCGLYTRTSGTDGGPATINIIGNTDPIQAVGGSLDCLPI